MKEPFNDDKLYSDEQDFGSIGLNNYKEALEKYSYERYVHRFRQMASGHQLKTGQRPKLDQNQYDALMNKLNEAFRRSSEWKFLQNEKTVKIAERLLIWSLFDADYCGMGISNWRTGKTGDY